MTCSPSICCRASSRRSSVGAAGPVERAPRRVTITPRCPDGIGRIDLDLIMKKGRSPLAVSPLAGKLAPKAMLVDLARLEREYRERRPDVGDPDQLVSFGTSGHRGSPLRGTFTEAHILAVTQA